MANNWRFFWLLIGLNHQSLILIGRQLRKYVPCYDRMNYGECLLTEGHYNTEWDPHFSVLIYGISPARVDTRNMLTVRVHKWIYTFKNK